MLSHTLIHFHFFTILLFYFFLQTRFKQWHHLVVSSDKLKPTMLKVMQLTHGIKSAVENINGISCVCIFYN